MKIKRFDHIVIPVCDIMKTIHFYENVLCMKVERGNNRYAVHFGQQKINFHTYPREFQPAAENPTYGSADICLQAEGSIKEIREELVSKGVTIELGIVRRQGAIGPIDSIYLRDPDNNLIEISTPAE